jgi:hypothetical protein
LWLSYIHGAGIAGIFLLDTSSMEALPHLPDRQAGRSIASWSRDPPYFYFVCTCLAIEIKHRHRTATICSVAALMLACNHWHNDAGSKTRETYLKTLSEMAIAMALVRHALSHGALLPAAPTPQHQRENVVI